MQSHTELSAKAQLVEILKNKGPGFTFVSSDTKKWLPHLSSGANPAGDLIQELRS